MDYETLRAGIKKISTRITAEDLDFLVNCAEGREMKKGELLLKEGEICRSFYFVEKGHLRTWYNRDGGTINLNFTFEGDFTCNLKSLKGRQGSEINIEAGEDTSLFIYNLDTINKQFEPNPQISIFVRRLAIHVLLASEEHSKLFKIYTPTERYRYVEQNNPKLLQRISLSQMASYLGVTRETLSRIRAKKV